ncbi:MAG: ATPase [Selenomonadaceae bacterium]|nr:ATPase [Selenomonadaceae bacterium]
MAVRDTLNQIEDLVASSSHLWFTDRIMINDNDLIHLVEELRQELPLELERADEIMRERDKIIMSAQQEATNIINQAQEKAAQIVDENDLVIKAREKAQAVMTQAQVQEQEIIERTKQNARELQDNADRYANQVFDQLIAHVTNTFQGVQQAQAGLDQARQILIQAKAQMNQQAVQQAYAQAQAQQPQQPQAYNSQATGPNM